MAETTFRSSGDKVLAVLCHVSSLFQLPLLFPLIVYLCTRNDHSLLTDNAREALNFHLTLILYWIVAGILTVVGIGLVLMGVLWFGGIVMGIIAAIKVSEAGFYRYPFTIRMVTG